MNFCFADLCFCGLLIIPMRKVACERKCRYLEELQRARGARPCPYCVAGEAFSGWAPIRHVNGSAIESLKFNHGRSACCGDEASEMVMFVFIFGCLCHDEMHRQLVGVTRDVSPSPGLLDLVTCIQLTLFSFRLPLRTSFSGLFLSSGTLSVDPSVTSRVPKSPTSVQLTFVALLDSFYLCI